MRLGNTPSRSFRDKGARRSLVCILNGKSANLSALAIHTVGMTCQELLRKQVDIAGFQLQKSFEGLTGDGWHHRSAPEAMSPYEMAVHLSECYTAALREFYGETHEWGSFVVEIPEPDPVLAKMFELRGQAAETLLLADDDEAMKHASDFLVLHDAYHVGQLATVRIQLGDWNPYAIYEMG